MVALVEEREVGVADMVVVFGVEDHTSGEGMVSCVSVLCVNVVCDSCQRVCESACTYVF